jgi:ABC-type multidrug transport system ATPase subunit
MIKITGLKKKYGANFTLEIPSLTIPAGARVALIGPNGAGKSTLLRLIAGILKPDEGEIEISVPKAAVGYQPQTPYAFKGTVAQNVRLAAGGREISGVLEACNLTELKDKKTGRISGGEKQRMCLARMLAGSYNLLLLDEPLSAADIETGALLERVLTKHCEENGTTLLFSTHLPKQAFDIANKILLLDGGKVVEYGGKEQFRTPKSDFSKAFFALWNL